MTTLQQQPMSIVRTAHTDDTVFAQLIIVLLGLPSAQKVEVSAPRGELREPDLFRSDFRADRSDLIVHVALLPAFGCDFGLGDLENQLNPDNLI